MREIQVAEHKTLKLTNVLSRKVEVEDMGNLAIADPDAELYPQP